MSEKERDRRDFLAKVFKNYYKSKFNEVFTPTDIERREFGFLYWNINQFERHHGFLDFQDLVEHVLARVPRHFHSSAARYGTPNAPNMKSKDYINCDLVFDLDIDKIPTPCKEEHDRWVCETCSKVGKGITPKICPNCDSKKFRITRWECDNCMEVAKSRIIILIEEILSEDFGLDSDNDLFVVFSGQRGYHIHIENDIYRELDSNARREIADYIAGKGLVPRFHRSTLWSERMVDLVFKLFDEAAPEVLQTILPENLSIKDAREEVASQLGFKSPVWVFNRIGEVNWNRLVQMAINEYGLKVDAPVTTDIHRLIRVPGSLHGSTGFLVKRLSLSELKEFDPFSQAQVFDGEKRIYVERSPSFRIGDEVFGPLNGEYVELPMNVAVFLLCKGLAFLRERD